MQSDYFSRYDEKSHIATAAQSPPWRKISLETGHRDVEPALVAEAFFTPGVHYRDGAVTFVRQKPLFDTATIGEEARNGVQPNYVGRRAPGLG